LTLLEDFVLAYRIQQNFQLKDWFPFRRPKRLPTKMELETPKLLVRYVLNIVKKYNSLMKRKSEASEKAISDRSNFNSDFVKLFDAADPLLGQKLLVVRIRNHFNVKHEDLEFPEDQRGPEWDGLIDKEDEQFGTRLKKCLKRKQSSSTASCPSTIQSQLVPDNRSAQDEINFPLVEEEDSDDSDHNTNIKKSKKSEIILMEIPRKILSPSLSQSLDRIKTLRPSITLQLEIRLPLSKVLKQLRVKT